MSAPTKAAATAASDSFVLQFVPEKTFNGDVVIRYALANRYGGATTGQVKILVRNLPNPARDAEVAGLAAAQDQSARRFGDAQITNVSRRLEAVRDRGARRNENGIGLSGAVSPSRTPDEDPTRLRLQDDLAATLQRGRATGQVSAVDALAQSVDGSSPKPTGPMSVWTNGTVELGRGASAGKAGRFDFTTAGVSVGADFAASDKLIVGAGVGFGRDLSRIGDNGTKSEASVRSAFVYGSYEPIKPMFVDAMVGGGAIDLRSNRYISVTGEYTSGKGSGTVRFASVSSGYAYRDAGLQLVGYGRLDYVGATLGAFTERGPEFYSLRFSERELSDVTGTLGVRGDYLVQIRRVGEVTPRFRFEYHRKLRDKASASVSFADWEESPTYTLDGQSSDADGATLGIGVGLRRKSGWRFDLDLEGGVANGVTQSTTVRVGAGGVF